MSEALNAANGKVYHVTLGTASTTNGLTSGTWYRISGKSSTGGLPANLSSGDIFYQKTSASPVTTSAMTSNDAVQAMTLTTLGFVTDFNESVSRQKFDVTVQTDDVKAFLVSDKPEWTFTLDGYCIDNDAKQQLFLKKLDTVIEQTSSGGITKTSPVTTRDYLMISKDETTAAGAQWWEFRPVILEGVSMGKPMEGAQPFSMSGTVDGGGNPATYVLDN